MRSTNTLDISNSYIKKMDPTKMKSGKWCVFVRDEVTQKEFIAKVQPGMQASQFVEKHSKRPGVDLECNGRIMKSEGTLD